MRSKLEILRSYKNYLEALNARGSDVFKTYEKMYQYIENEAVKVDDELYVILWASCAENALKVIRRRNLYFKEGYGWSKRMIDDCMRFIDLLKECDGSGSSTWKINTYRLYKLFKRTTSPNLRLYLISKYGEELEEGNDFLENCDAKVSRLLEASTEEEIEEILNSTTKKVEELEVAAS